MEKDRIRMFVTDLDGTLLSRFSTLSDRAAEDLKKLKDNGIIVVICTGRPFYSVNRIIPEELYDYAICMNGQDIYLPNGRRHIRQPYLRKEQVEYLLSFLERYPLVAECNINDSSHYYIAKKYLFLRRGIDLIKYFIDILQHSQRYPITVMSHPINSARSALPACI